MKSLYLFLFIVLILSCEKDPQISYPKTYTFSHIENGNEGLFLLTSPSTYTALNINSGSYGKYSAELKSDVVQTMQITFDLQEVELLSENMLRIHWITDESDVFDTTVTYTTQDKEILIEALEGSNLLTYNSDKDQFEVCAMTNFAIPGSNVISPGQEYNQFNTQECKTDYSIEDYLEEMLDSFDYSEGDTLGILLTRFIYK